MNEWNELWPVAAGVLLGYIFRSTQKSVPAILLCSCLAGLATSYLLGELRVSWLAPLIDTLMVTAFSLLAARINLRLSARTSLRNRSQRLPKPGFPRIP